jgi:hypothetical protein
MKNVNSNENDQLFKREFALDAAIIINLVVSSTKEGSIDSARRVDAPKSVGSNCHHLVIVCGACKVTTNIIEITST